MALWVRIGLVDGTTVLESEVKLAMINIYLSTRYQTMLDRKDQLGWSVRHGQGANCQEIRQGLLLNGRTGMIRSPAGLFGVWECVTATFIGRRASQCTHVLRSYLCMHGVCC
jgi:hypothetical protein